MSRIRLPFAALLIGFATSVLAPQVLAQLVILPAPRLLTLMPMGAKVGGTVEITITGENVDEEAQLLFSSPKIVAEPKMDAAGVVLKNKFVVTVSADAHPGVYDARLMTRLGISSARCFSVGTFAEVTRLKPNTTLETAFALEPNSLCNAFTTARAVDFYSFTAKKGERFVIDCAAQGIDSRLTPVLILADGQGRDIRAERQSGLLDFTAATEGNYIVKVHGLTYQGGGENFYRLVFAKVPEGESFQRQPYTRSVGSASAPKNSPSADTLIAEEVEPNDKAAQAQKVTLPCAIHGRFAKAGDVDTYEFSAKKGDVWWVEVLSERLGLPTDPFVLVQQVKKNEAGEQLSDVAEFNDIVSPVKLSTNGYAYDGVPYDVGSPDPYGKFEVKEDGLYRLQIRDLFGGTRSEPRNIYQLNVRKAEPDFSLVAWALHMELRNGDRAALSKPVSLRGGATMGLDVVVVRRDGFDGEIELGVENLPPGVSATGLRIPSGKSQGYVLLTAAENAPRGMALARVFGRGKVNGVDVTRECPTASMVWPVKDAMGEIPSPRLMADFPVSVGGDEVAPLTITCARPEPIEATVGGKLTIPLKLTWRGEFSGGPVKLKPLGADFASMAPVDVPSKADKAELVLDLASLKATPGDYTLAVHGGVVAKYRYNLGALKAAELAQNEAESKVAEVAAELQRLSNVPKAGAGDTSSETALATRAATERMKVAEANKSEAVKRLKAVTEAAAPKDIVDIVFSEPIRIQVKAMEAK